MHGFHQGFSDVVLAKQEGTFSSHETRKEAEQ